MKKISFLTLSFFSVALFFFPEKIMARESYKNKILLAQANRPQNISQNQNIQIIKLTSPQKSFWQKTIENTSLNYYQQFLGPTLNSGSQGITYNVFQEGANSPGSGFAPWQSFHSLNLKHKINSNWAIGGTLSLVNGYTDEVENFDRDGQSFVNSGDTVFFNSRLYLSLPSLQTNSGTLFTTVSYEFPTSSISQDDDMTWAWVLAQSFAVKLPSYRWNLGLMAQVYRIYYKQNVKPPLFAPELGGRPLPLQTLIITGGPYVNYRINDHFLLGTTFSFDWDQKGDQTGTTKVNNNLSDRFRVNFTYFPSSIPYLRSVGVFSQALVKYSPDTTSLGADFSLSF